MQTEELRIAARTRSGWEAVDLGFAMARAWWRPIWGAWFLMVIPIATAGIVALRGSPWWTLLLLWWLRPLFGRVVLHVLGEALFSDPPSPVATLRALPRILRGGVLASLTVLRLSPNRCYALPVLQLEGLRGAARRERTRVLTRAELGPAASMHSIAAHLNGALILALLVFAYWLAPQELVDRTTMVFSAWFEGDVTAGGLGVAFLYLAGTTVVEPLLVAGGFGLYVNRRMWLEGWDVEIAFRGLARRFEPGVALRRTAAVVPVLIGLVIAPAARAEVACIPEEIRSAASCAQEILEHEDFGHWEQVENWVLREFDMSGEEFEWPEWALQGELGEAIARLAEIVLWIGLAFGVILLGVHLARMSAQQGSPREPAAPVELFGLDLDPESLPDDIAAAAREAFAAGDAIGALSLLYRGALILLIDGRGLQIPSSATEGDCLRAVRATSDAELLDDFGALNEAWVRSRYARAPIGAEHFADVCRRWAPRLLEPIR